MTPASEGRRWLLVAASSRTELEFRRPEGRAAPSVYGRNGTSLRPVNTHLRGPALEPSMTKSIQILQARLWKVAVVVDENKQIKDIRTCIETRTKLQLTTWGPKQKQRSKHTRHPHIDTRWNTDLSPNRLRPMKCAAHDHCVRQNRFHRRPHHSLEIEHNSADTFLRQQANNTP